MPKNVAALQSLPLWPPALVQHHELAIGHNVMRAQRTADEERIKSVCDDIREAFEKRNTFMHGVFFEHSVATLDDVEDFDALTSFDDLTTTRIRNRHANDEDSGSSLSEADDVADALTIARDDLAALFP